MLLEFPPLKINQGGASRLETQRGKLTPGACARGGLAKAGAAGLRVSHLLSLSGFRNMQLVFSLRAQDGKVKKVQGNFLIMYASILKVRFCDISGSKDTELATLACSPVTAAFKFKPIIA